VTGAIAPVSEIGEIAAECGPLLLVDASQAAGHVDVDARACRVDLLAMTGHKGLLGPTGTGALYVRRGITLSPLLTGGTGVRSDSLEHPGRMPDVVEAGTMNAVGIVGLLAGMKYLERVGVKSIRAHERRLTGTLLDALEGMPTITAYGPADVEQRLGVISFTLDGYSPAEAGYVLDRHFGIMCRVGLHCAPLIHERIGSAPHGTVRVSVGPFNTLDHVARLVSALDRMVAAEFRESLPIAI
jgi:selenocysteine lyase/cysteine desulfurase